MTVLSWSLVGLALGSSLLVGVMWGVAVQRFAVRAWLPWILGTSGVAVAVSIAAAVVGGDLVRIGLSAVAASTPLAFLALQLIARQRQSRLPIHVGGSILEFEAVDSAGRPFHLASLRGRPYLLKFYRGHW